jgi:hypothetical protein
MPALGEGAIVMDELTRIEEWITETRDYLDTALPQLEVYAVDLWLNNQTEDYKLVLVFEPGRGEFIDGVVIPAVSAIYRKWDALHRRPIIAREGDRVSLAWRVVTTERARTQLRAAFNIYGVTPSKTLLKTYDALYHFRIYGSPGERSLSAHNAWDDSLKD